MADGNSPLRAKVGLGVALVVALLSLTYALPRLRFSNDRTRLLSSDHPAQVRYERFRELFGAESDLAILISGPGPRQPAVEWLVAQRAGLTGYFDLPHLPSQALYYLSESQLRQLSQQLAQAQKLLPLLQANPLPLALREGSPLDPEVREQLHLALESRGRWDYRSPLGPPLPVLTSRILLELGPQATVVKVASVPIAQLEPLLGQARLRFPQLSFLLVGERVAAEDDAGWARRTALQATLISLLLVHAFFRWAFGHSKPPRLALASVLVGLAWSCAWVAWTTPVLNVVTLNFCATLIGLGMDFHVQMIYRYQETGSLPATLASVGRDNFLGALASSSAFLSLTATPFTAVAQLGRINALGVLLAWLASVTVLPALLLIFGCPRRPPRMLVQPRRLWPLALALVLSLLALSQLSKVRFDENLLNLLPKASASIQIDQQFHQRAGCCSLYALSLAQGEAELRQRTGQFRALAEVARVESPADWLPPQPAPRQPLVRDLCQQAAKLEFLPEIDKPLSPAMMLRLRETLGDRLDPKLAPMGPGPLQDGLTAFLGHLTLDVNQRLRWLKQQRPEPLPQWSQWQAAGLGDYRRQDTWLIKIYARSELWDGQALREWLSQLAAIDPQITGRASLNQAYLEELSNCYWQAGRNALLAITMILLLAFRRLDLMMLALLPKLLGGLWMLGAMGWWGVAFNAANATALPLTLGIGLVFGIHVVHSRQQLETSSTAEAVLVSGVSTILGYAALMLSPYRGVASLGWVMTVGVGCSLLASLLVLPALLALSKFRDTPRE